MWDICVYEWCYSSHYHCDESFFVLSIVGRERFSMHHVEGGIFEIFGFVDNLFEGTTPLHVGISLRSAF